MSRVIVGKSTGQGRTPLAVRRTSLPVTAIQVGEQRVRGVEETIVQALMASIDRVGLRQRIVVGPENELIAGLQRLEALKRLGYELVPVEILNLSEVKRQIVEIDENLARGNLEGWPLARALERQKELYLLHHPETARGSSAARQPRGEQGQFVAGDGSSQNANYGEAPAFARKAATLTGKNHSTVARAIQLGAAFTDTQKEILEAAGVPPTRALDIARLPQVERDTIVGRIQAEGGKQLREILGPHYGKALGDRRGIGVRRQEEWAGVESPTGVENGNGATDAESEGADSRSVPAPRRSKAAEAAKEREWESHLNRDSERPPQFNVPATPRAAGRELAARFNQPGERILLVTTVLKGHPEEIRETVLSLLDDWSHTEEEMLDLFFEAVGLSVVHMKEAFLARLDALNRNPTLVVAGKNGR